jgi:23S rRNA (adenine2030-N6)-methyltransferase
MNYRHAFHAGNFADLQKHAIVLALLKALTADPAPLSVIDTHAGAGAYDLGGDMAQRSGEARRASGGCWPWMTPRPCSRPWSRR